MWADDIAKSRQYGLTRCCCVSSARLSLHEALSVFGLRQDEESLTQVSAEEGARLLERLLATSLVDNLDAMPRDVARRASADFIETFRAQACSFYTNGNWASSDAPSWNPLTSAVFDGGLIALGPTISGCVWVDEND